MGRLVKKIVLPVIMVLFLISQCTVYAQNEMTNRSFNWIISEQSQDGYWGNPDLTPERDTSEVMDALAGQDILHLNPQMQEALEKAANWLGMREAGSYDYLSRKATALEVSGEDVAAYKDRLAAAQNNDGGWGFDEGFQSTVPDTVEVLKLFMNQQDKYEKVVEKGIGFLLSRQNGDGSFSFSRGTEGDIETTSDILLIFSVLQTKDESVKNGIQSMQGWLLNYRNSDGSFGIEGGNAKSTALAYSALIQSGFSPVELSPSLACLANSQMENGSWDNNILTTALAVKAFRNAEANLVIAQEDIILPDGQIVDGSTMTVRARVKNYGGMEAGSFSVGFFEGNPDTGGALIGQKQIIDTLLPGEEREVQTQWTVSTPGTKAVYVRVDAEDYIKESRENDNTAFKTIDVLPKPDFRIESGDISFNPQVPGSGDEVTITAFVTNWSDGKADGMKTKFYMNAPDQSGILIGEASMTETVEGWETVRIDVRHIFDVGTHKIYVVIDPDNEVCEMDEGNNTEWIEIQVPAKKDLEITSADITFSPVQPVRNEIVKIAAIVKNRDINASQNVNVSFYDGDPKDGGVLIGEDTIQQIEGGLTGKAEVYWHTLNQVGTHYIYVIVDEDNLIEETNKGNNGGVITIPVYYSGGIINGIDLEISGQDIVASPQDATILDILTLSAIVRNNGNQGADNITVEFYDGNPQNGGQKLGEILLPHIEPRSMEIAQITWDLQSQGGQHNIFVVVDGGNSVSEVKENNNTAYKSINVSGDTSIVLSVKSIDTGNFPEINLTAQVSRLSGDPIFGLVSGNFGLSEDGTDIQLRVNGSGSGEYQAPKVDIQFVVDTSGSMSDEWTELNSLLSSLTQSISNLGIDLDYTLYTLGENLTKGIYRGREVGANSEDWGPGTAWVAQNHPWRDGAFRIIIPISDENAYHGGSSSTSEDISSVTEAGEIANDNDVTVYPFYGDGTNSSVITNMQRLAAATGGEVFYFAHTSGVTESLQNIIVKAASTYVISFITPNPVSDGTQRLLQLSLEHNGATGETGTSYWAPCIMLPDLNMDQELHIEDASLYEGEVTAIKATVSNYGGAAAENIELAFYEVNSLGEETRIGSTKTIDRLEPGQTETITLNWTSRSGARKIRCKADPYNEIQEIDENNNQAEAKVYVYTVDMPDLSISDGDITYSPANPLVGDHVEIRAVVRNTGAPSSQVAVEFYAGDPDSGGKRIGQRQIIDYMGKGTQEEVSVTWNAPVIQAQDIYVIVDPDDRVAEDKENNNTASISITFEEPDVAIQLSADKHDYNAFEDIQMQMQVINNGNGVTDGIVVLYVIDAQDNTVETVDEISISGLAPADVFTAMASWNTGYTLAGNYSIKAVFMRNGKPISTEREQFTILPDRSIDIDFITDRAAYNANQYVNSTSEVVSKSKNYVFTNIRQEIVVFSEDGEEMFRDDTLLDMLFQGETRINGWSWFTGTNQPGIYKAKLITTEGEETLDQQEIIFEIMSSSQTGSAVAGRITDITDEVIIGGDFEITYHIENVGNEDISIPVKVMIIEAETGTILETLTDQVELDMNSEETRIITKHNLRLPAGESYMVVLRAELSGQEKTLDSSHVDILPPDLSFDERLEYKPGVLVWTDDDINEELIEEALDDKECFYKLVHNNNSFIEELMTDRYRTYFILDPQHPFTGHQSDELESRVQAGDGIFGTNDANKGQMRVSELFGIDFKGYLPPSDREVVFYESEISEADEMTFYGKFQKPEVTTAEVAAITTAGGRDYPVILLNSYGDGKAVFMTFDPAETVSEYVYGDIHSVYGRKAIEIYANGIDYLSPGDKDEFEKNDVLEITVEFHNSGPETELKLEALLPQGLTVLEAEGAAVEENKLVWNMELDEDKSRTVKYILQITGELEQDCTIENKLYYLNVDNFEKLDAATIIIPVKQ